MKKIILGVAVVIVAPILFIKLRTMYKNNKQDSNAVQMTAEEIANLKLQK
jgi:hypothetical protein